MRLGDLEKRILTLETRVHVVDEAGLVAAAMRREHHLSHGLPCPAHVLDLELDRLKTQESLPAGTSNLIAVAWEILRNPGPQYTEVPCE